jgi:hypothetical protein
MNINTDEAGPLVTQFIGGWGLAPMRCALGICVSSSKKLTADFCEEIAA